jgi:hypothetical protein
MKNIMTRVFPAKQITCQPCLTTRLFFSILKKHIQLFYKDFRAELKSYSKINQAACYITKQESIDPDQREKFYDDLKKIREKHGLAPDYYSGFRIKARKNHIER